MGKLTFEEKELILAYIDDLVNQEIEKTFVPKTGFSRDAKSIVSALETLRYESLNYRTKIINQRQSDKREIANLTHDLKTPIAVIAGSCECLEDGINDKDYIAIIKQKATELNNNVLRIISSSKEYIESEKNNKHIICTREFFSPVFKKYAFMINGKGLRYIIKKVPDVEILGSETQMISVVDNLISNALKHTNQGKIKIKFKVTKEDFSFSVIDSGSGISKKDIPLIFERFYSGDKARTNGSTGIGLHYVKQIIKEHSGEVSVKSKVGKGTNFTVKIPLAQAHTKKLSQNTKKYIEASLRVFLFPFFIPIDFFRAIYYGILRLTHSS